MHLLGWQVKNLDSLENIAIQKKSNTVAYLSLLLNIENSRIRYKPDLFGSNFEEIRQLAIRLKNADGMAIYNYFVAVKAIAYTQDFRKAFVYYTKALDGFKSTKDSMGIIKVNIELSKLNLNQYGKVTGSIEQQLAYAQEAVRVARLTKNKEIIVRSMHNEAAYYFAGKNEDLIKFESILQRILKITDKDPDLIRLHRLYQMDLGQMYAKKGYYQKAIELFEPSLKNESSIVSAQNRFILFVNASETYIDLKNYKKSRLYAFKALAIAKQYNNPEQLQTSYMLLEALTSATGDYKKALAYAKINRDMADSLAELNKTQQLNDLQIKYQTTKKEQVNKLLQQQNNFIKTQNRQYLVGLAVAILAITLIIILAIYLIRSNKRLTAANRELDHLTKAQKRFFSIIAHDLRTPITTFTGLFDVANHLLKTNQLNRLKSVSDQIDMASIKVNQLLRNLLEYAQFDYYKKYASDESVQLKSIIDEVLSIYEVVASGRDITCSSSCPPALTVMANPDDISLVLRNLTDNALKNLKPGGTLLIKAEAVSQRHVRLIIQDNGKGIRTELLQHLQTVFSRTTSGFLGEQGLGLGMLLVNEAIGRSNGTISIESEFGRFTTITILLPIGLISPKPKDTTIEQPLVRDL